MRTADRAAGVTRDLHGASRAGLAAIGCCGLAILVFVAAVAPRAIAAPLDPSSPDTTSIAPEDSLETPEFDDTELPGAAGPDSEETESSTIVPTSGRSAPRAQ